MIETYKSKKDKNNEIQKEPKKKDSKNRRRKRHSQKEAKKDKNNEIQVNDRKSQRRKTAKTEGVKGIAKKETKKDKHNAIQVMSFSDITDCKWTVNLQKNPQSWYSPNAWSGYNLPTGSIPADVRLKGDPTKDQKLDLSVDTPLKTYNLQLERYNGQILHEDVKVLSVSVDASGKTVFTEQYKPVSKKDPSKYQVDLQAKAKSMNFYHDVNSGTFLNIKAQKKGSADEPHAYVEGVLYDELFVAPPDAVKRHKRELHPVKHTIWKHDEASDKGLFHFDTVKVPEVVELMHADKYKSEKHHRIHKRQYRNPPRIEPELLLFIDFALYQEFQGESNELLEYLLHFWHAVNWKYLTIALAGRWPVVDIKIREIGVFKEPNAQPFIESTRIHRGSKLFSLYDAMDSLQKWLENACRKTKHRNDPIVPFHPDVLKAIRLGAYHDGEAEASTCPTRSGFIMSYTRDDSFKFSRFSDCSIRSFQKFINMDRAQCLLQRSSREILQFPTTFPGKYMTLSEQCRRFTGGPPCQEGPTQCEHLCCDDRNGEWRYTRSEPAVDGTGCGSNRDKGSTIFKVTPRYDPDENCPELNLQEEETQSSDS
ncbi:hypothetical protein KUTeg_016369 [Tegillarca granosa]|uniref:Peptidase M12B domain-containing protein n=1 Tax=Tegillarca granosa TaxID=220873 RepID=A0ABQ9EKN6_TEGGR|nr:hypothetical protein KUTeg_016369 [Tegillarca granosa]